jgi:hypothetical protein
MSCLEYEAGRDISVREAAEVIGEKLAGTFLRKVRGME